MLFVVVYGSIELLANCGLILLKKYVYLDYYPNDVLSERHASAINELIDLKSNNYTIYSSSLGWTIKPNDVSKLYQANAAGIRSTKNYTKIPEKGILRMSSYGDSYTHCDDVSNDETWQIYIENSDAKLEVINFGVGGYGTDQSFLRYLETTNQYKTDYVLIGYMTENLARNVNTFRPFYVPMSGLPLTKPRFLVKNDTLTLIPNYMRKLDEYKNILNNPQGVTRKLGVNDYFYNNGYQSNIFDWSPILRILKIAKKIVKLKFTDNAINKNGIYNENSEAFIVTSKLIDEFYNRVINDGAIPIILVFPHNKDIARYQSNDKKQYLPLIKYFDSKGFKYIDLMDVLGDKDMEELFNGHYSPYANGLVASKILSYIKNIDEYKFVRFKTEKRIID